ncbi:NUD22 pyrophosphatase, partial [Amia calva]|nr:NUD22 pyrophosphatase [Amia calva]
MVSEMRALQEIQQECTMNILTQCLHDGGVTDQIIENVGETISEQSPVQAALNHGVLSTHHKRVQLYRKYSLVTNRKWFTYALLNSRIKSFPGEECQRERERGRGGRGEKERRRGADRRGEGRRRGEEEEDEKEGAVLTLCLGLTCYRDFLGTNWSEGARGLRARGQTQYGDPLALLAQPLGVGGVVITGDGGVVFLRRSQRVGEAAGLIDIPGGHPEPTVVVPGVGEDSVTLEQLSEEGVLKELFSSILNEIRDEVNIPLQYLSEPLLLGIALNHTSAGRPSAEFFISPPTTSESNQTSLFRLCRFEVLQLDESSPLWPELCPSAKGAVLLYRLVQPDKEG